MFDGTVEHGSDVRDPHLQQARSRRPPVVSIGQQQQRVTEGEFGVDERARRGERPGVGDFDRVDDLFREGAEPGRVVQDDERVQRPATGRGSPWPPR
ncbi:hypothetical protein EIL87_01440 [Saccharopolyspora rhizosphaerae]|uniref:Uncharacterized protein n=1 Tax=Saccharopolyspora rhizosphaerae TaxID=2492662 RepID=A0A3R8R846_9PSEU|nr:hypothetical protein [Saccharopolyspora rhizosphaerae]RRO20573.1 hypothetical protein EIL87_01440 [Saccharopolyspora rhizosphaerae]